ncbi:hypothetical protein [Halobaculum marinum]|uniref:Response regulatory domain-containing protein n=1 Tax=Halobaculum marinum TaxID=3031996 RepID=A0ABD5X0J2_9EURY|nr:hypothetical protein [Halobaculum sp. DT55]
MSAHITEGDAEENTGDTDRVQVVHVEHDCEVAALAEQYLSIAYPEIDLRHVADPDAVAAAVADGADCVVTDHRPPLTDAAAVAETVSNVDSDVPVVVYSAAPDETLVNADGVVAKRAGLDGLDTLVERVVDAVGRANVD